MRCDIVIAVWNLKNLTQGCIESIIAHTQYPYRLIVIDNGSEAETRDYLESLKKEPRLKGYLLIRNKENVGATKAFNQGMEASDAPYILLLNNDTLVFKGWLTEMVTIAEKSPEIGIVNPSSNNFGHKPKKGESLSDFASKCRRRRRGEYIEMATATGFCYLLKRKVIDAIGLWNEGYGKGNFEETEHCIKAREAGFKMVIAKGAYVYHKEQSSFKLIDDYEALFKKNQKKFEEVFGKPDRLLYVFTKNNRLLFYTLRKKIYDTANQRHWIHVFKKTSVGEPGLVPHTNVKTFSFPAFFFRLRCVYKVLVKKKRYNTIYVDDKKLFKQLTKMKRFHHAEIKRLDPKPKVNFQEIDVGCGGAKTRGAIGVDMAAQENVDIVCDLNKYPWPFKDNTFDMMHCISVVEHLDNVVKTMEELHRIGKNGSVIIIDTSHFAHPNSYRDPTHKWHFSIGTFDYFTGEVLYPRYSKLKFKMLKKELRFRKKYCTGKVYAFFSPRRYEKYFCHKCPPHSIYFELEIVKD